MTRSTSFPGRRGAGLFFCLEPHELPKPVHDEDAVDLHQWISELGLPVGLLAFGIYGAWRAARYLAPLIRSVAEKHCELIATLEAQSARQTEIMESQRELLMRHGDLLQEIHLAVEEERSV